MQATEPICCERVNNSSGCPCGYRKEDERCIALVSFKSDSLEDEIKKKGNKLCEGGGKLAGGNLSQSDIDFITKSHQADIRVLDLKKVNNDFFVRISTGEPEEISEFLAAKIIEMENGKSIFDGKPISFGPSIIENKSMQEVFVFCEARIGNEWWKS
ncbi:hypothetical protein L596_008366 [Steinernema carpocapsae]|uniref:Uncharacterized protein n=1 Tax=Steinernema carpocapsae TaxID=34508 RepID=A0A4U5PCJ1_STECR|nr:hypothetical protein L596_008366 [Steinernema carpocapsae]